MSLTSLIKSAAVAATLIATTITAQAGNYQAGDIAVDHPWIKATLVGAKVGGGYLKIKNTGKEDDRLVSGTLTKAGQTEIHEMSLTNGVMNMAQLKDGLVLKPGQTVELKPGSFHMMFLGLKEQLKAGDKVKGTLVFEKAGSIEIEYTVKPLTAKRYRGSHSGH